jgi:hypothetical protein
MELGFNVGPGGGPSSQGANFAHGTARETTNEHAAVVAGGAGGGGGNTGSATAQVMAYRSRNRYYLNRPLYAADKVDEVTIGLADGWYVEQIDSRRRLLGPPGKSGLALDQAIRAGIARVV